MSKLDPLARCPASGLLNVQCMGSICDCFPEEDDRFGIHPEYFTVGKLHDLEDVAKEFGVDLDKPDSWGRFWGKDCPKGPHRRPEGPCEDAAVCPECHSLTWAMRPPGECYGHHAPDCSLPERHESFCKPGGAGHPTGVLRGYPEFTWESR